MARQRSTALFEVMRGSSKPGSKAGLRVDWPWHERGRRSWKGIRFIARTIGGATGVGKSTAWRYRAALAPWTVVGLVVVALRTAQHTAHPTVVGLITALGFAVGAIVAADRTRGEQASFVASVGMAATSAWVAVAAVAGTSSQPVRVLALLIFLAVSSRWWQLHRFGAGSFAKAVTEMAGLALTWRLRMGSAMPDVQVVPGSEAAIMINGTIVGREALIEAGDDSDLTTNDMIAKTAVATAKFKLPFGQFAIDAPDDGRMDRARIAMFHTNPLRQPQIWPGSDFNLEAGTSSAGVLIDGSLPTYVWSIPKSGAWHDLVAGTNGAGKSSFISMLLATSRAAGGAIVDWVIDPQEGQSAPAWVGNVDRFATTAETGLILLRQAEQVMYARNKLLSSYKWTDEKGRKQPGYSYFPWMSINMPLLVITVFEAHAVLALPGAREVVENIAKMARKCGIKLRLEVQVPLLDQLGNSQTIRDQVAAGNVIVFRTANRLTAQVAFNGALPVDPSLIPKLFPGKEPVQERITAGLGFLLGGEASSLQLRAWVEEDPLDNALAGQTWHLDEYSQGHAGQWPPAPEDVVAEATRIAAVAAAGTEEAETEQQAGTTRELILAALEEGNYLFNDLMTKTGKSRSSVYGAVRKLIAEGKVVETADGPYSLVKEKTPA